MLPRCLVVLLSCCPIVLLPQCPVVPLPWCPVVPLSCFSRCSLVLLSCYSLFSNVRKLKGIEGKTLPETSWAPLTSPDTPWTPSDTPRHPKIATQHTQHCPKDSPCTHKDARLPWVPSGHRLTPSILQENALWHSKSSWNCLGVGQRVPRCLRVFGDALMCFGLPKGSQKVSRGLGWVFEDVFPSIPFNFLVSLKICLTFFWAPWSQLGLKYQNVP